MRKLSWLSFAILTIIAACTKIETTTIGNGLIPPVDNVNTFEANLDIETNTFFDLARLDSARVYKTDDQVIGKISNDPVFGTTTAAAYFELKPTYYKYYFAAGGTGNPVSPDSAVLILSYKGTYGDTTIAAASQTWEVYEVGDKIKEDSAYPVSHSFATGDFLGSKTFSPHNVGDSVKYGFENATNQIRIKLNASVASKFISTFDSASGHAYESDSLFRVNFKGFAVKAVSGNALIRINLLDTNTKLALFYNYARTDTPSLRTHAVSYFRFSPGYSTAVSGSANYIHRDFSGSQVAQFSNTGNNDSLAFVQTYPGTYVKLKIPGLDSFQNSIIHLAELSVLQVPDPLSSTFTAPRYLLLSGFDSTNWIKTNVRNDFLINSGGYLNTIDFGGYLSQKNIPGVGDVSSYSFNLSRYVQGIVTRKDKNNTLFLSAPNNDTLQYSQAYPAPASPFSFRITNSSSNQAAMGRVRFGGGGMSAGNPLRMRLRIIYSKL